MHGTDDVDEPSPVSDLVVLGVPVDANSSYLRGCAAGPARIRAALTSGSGNDATERGVEVVPQLVDLGDVAVANAAGSVEDADLITAAIEVQIAGGKRVIALGGDHSITYPILRAVAAHHGAVTVVHFDAHPDTYDDFEGNPLSHASPFARALEAGCIGRLVQLGIRTANTHAREQAARFGIEMYSPRGLHLFDPRSLAGPVYVTIDLDGLDPSVAPGVSHHEPGGLTVREVLDVLDALPATIVGADIVEYNPGRDVVDMTAMVGAKLLKEVAGAMLARAPGAQGT